MLTYADVSPAPAPQDGRAEGERLIELYRAEMAALRLYVHIAERLRVPPAEGLAERVRTARQNGNRWSMHLALARAGPIGRR
ncbi:hypothetical protein [Streptomyces puniciscabiei]|uniref:hypothetical protein n=1 Tax=Streptomyces puniciscabiei TaxID=164348 RepID=UPI0033283238